MSHNAADPVKLNNVCRTKLKLPYQTYSDAALLPAHEWCDAWIRPEVSSVSPSSEPTLETSALYSGQITSPCSSVDRTNHLQKKDCLYLFDCTPHPHPLKTLFKEESRKNVKTSNLIFFPKYAYFSHRKSLCLDLIPTLLKVSCSFTPFAIKLVFLHVDPSSPWNFK